MISIISKGNTEYSIVRGENASSSEVTATEELQKYLKQISGVELPILTDKSEVKEKEIIVGKTNREAIGEFDRSELGDDGFIIKTTGKKLWLVGGEQRGTLYSVYELLEEFLGCRFFTETLEVVPQKDTVSLDDIECYKRVPVFEYRDAFWIDYFEERISAKRRINASRHGLTEKFGGCRDYAGNMCHTVFDLVPRSYFSEHPEYFAMNKNGVRETKELCLTNPDVIKIAIENARQQILDKPDAKMISITQRDTLTPCLCPECRKVFAEEGGSYSGTNIRFVNAIANALKDEFPDMKFDTFAYRYTRSIPTKTKPADNVLIRLCSIECCFSHPLENDCPSVASIISNMDGSANSFLKDIQDWASISNSLYVWDYTVNFRNYGATFPNFGVLRSNAKFFADNHVVGMFGQGNYQDNGAEFGELRAYMLSKVYWDPYMSEEQYWAYLDEFLKYYYGPGWKNIREYIDICESDSEFTHFDIYTEPFKIFNRRLVEDHNRPLPEDLTLDKILDYKNTDWSGYSYWYKHYEMSVPAARGFELFDRAYDEAENDTQRFNIRKSRTQVAYQRSSEKRENMNLIKENIRELIEKYFAAHPNEADKKQKAILRSLCGTVALNQAEQDYVGDNYELYEEFRKHDVVRSSEYFKLNGDIELNFENPPHNWHKY